MKHSEESLLSNKQQKLRFGRNCIFCNDEQHWSGECSRYPDIQSHWKQLKNQCLKCMKQDHMVKDCRVTGKVCIHCGKKDKLHHTLCPKKFKNKEETTTNNAIVANNVLSKDTIPNKECCYVDCTGWGQHQQIKCYLKLQECWWIQKTARHVSERKLSINWSYKPMIPTN